MTVIMISDIEGQSPDGYDAMLGTVSDALKASAGFHLHTSHPTDTGWRVVEIWDSREHAARFYAAHIAPRLPDGLRPKLSFQPLHSLVRPAA